MGHSRNTQIEALEPCPFCGCTDVSNNDDGDHQWYECDWCHATSGFDPEPEFEGLHPSFHWNRRAIRGAAAPSEEPVAAINGSSIASFVRSYQFDASDEGFLYTPDFHEQCMLEDAICSFISDPDLLQAALASPAVAPVAVSVKGMIDQITFLRMMREAGYDHTKVHPDCYGDFSWTTLHLALSSIIPATKGGEDALRQVRGMLEVEYHDDGRIASVGHASDGLRKMVAFLDAALAQDTDATPPSDTEEKVL